MSFVPEHRLILATHVGRHQGEDAQYLIDKSRRRLGRPLPLFVSDGWDAYSEALFGAYYWLIECPPNKRGRPPRPKKVPELQLRYAQLVKIRKKGRVVSINKRVIFGEEETIKKEDISTSLIERENLSLRQDNRRLSRKTICFSKDVKMLDHQLTLYQVYFNFIKTHLSLRLRIYEQVSGKVYRRWRPRTPAMSAGITDHVWTLRELLMYKPRTMSTN